eukprot:746522-Hanusia_phi.AAC.14
MSASCIDGSRSILRGKTASSTDKLFQPLHYGRAQKCRSHRYDWDGIHGLATAEVRDLSRAISIHERCALPDTAANVGKPEDGGRGQEERERVRGSDELAISFTQERERQEAIQRKDSLNVKQNQQLDHSSLQAAECEDRLPSLAAPITVSNFAVYGSQTAWPQPRKRSIVRSKACRGRRSGRTEAQPRFA